MYAHIFPNLNRNLNNKSPGTISLDKYSYDNKQLDGDYTNRITSAFVRLLF